MADGVRGWRERGLQTLWFEGLGLAVVAPLYGWAVGAGAGESFSLVVALSGVVMAWSAVFNTAFDIVEFRRTGRVASARPRWLRAMHAIGFETTAMGVSVPVIYAMSNYSWMQALQADVALTLAYAAYAYVFHALYDRWRPVSAWPISGASNPGLAVLENRKADKHPGGHCGGSACRRWRRAIAVARPAPTRLSR